MNRLYHATARENRDSILCRGLDARFSDAAQTAGDDYCGGGGIFFNSVPSDGGEGIDVWAVDVRGIPLERDQTTAHDHTGEEWWVCYDLEVIEPTRLALVQP